MTDRPTTLTMKKARDLHRLHTRVPKLNDDGKRVGWIRVHPVSFRRWARERFRARTLVSPKLARLLQVQS